MGSHQRGFRLLSEEELLAQLKPVRYDFYTGREYKHPNEWIWRNCDSHSKYFAQYWPFPKAYKLVVDYEREKSFRYHWIIRTRPDITFSVPFVGLPAPLHVLATLPPTVFGQKFYHG